MCAAAVHWVSRLALNLFTPPVTPSFGETRPWTSPVWTSVNQWPQLSHYATMDPDSFNFSPSRKHNTRQISCHYLAPWCPQFEVIRQFVAFVSAVLMSGTRTVSLLQHSDICEFNFCGAWLWQTEHAVTVRTGPCVVKDEVLDNLNAPSGPVWRTLGSCRSSNTEAHRFLLFFLVKSLDWI